MRKYFPLLELKKLAKTIQATLQYQNYKIFRKKENYISVYINDNNLYLFVVNKNQFTTDKIDLTRNDIIKLIKKLDQYLMSSQALKIFI